MDIDRLNSVLAHEKSNIGESKRSLFIEIAASLIIVGVPAGAVLYVAYMGIAVLYVAYMGIAVLASMVIGG